MHMDSTSLKVLIVLRVLWGNCLFQWVDSSHCFVLLSIPVLNILYIVLKLSHIMSEMEKYISLTPGPYACTVSMDRSVEDNKNGFLMDYNVPRIDYL